LTSEECSTKARAVCQKISEHTDWKITLLSPTLQNEAVVLYTQEKIDMIKVKMVE